MCTDIQDVLEKTQHFANDVEFCPMVHQTPENVTTLITKNDKPSGEKSPLKINGTRVSEGVREEEEIKKVYSFFKILESMKLHGCVNQHRAGILIMLYPLT